MFFTDALNWVTICGSLVYKISFREITLAELGRVLLVRQSIQSQIKFPELEPIASGCSSYFMVLTRHLTQCEQQWVWLTTTK